MKFLLFLFVFVYVCSGASFLPRQTVYPGTGTCNSACVVPTGFCSAIITGTSCTSGSTNGDVNMMTEETVETVYNGLLAAFDSTGIVATETCKTEAKRYLCSAAIPACTGTSYKKDCRSVCDDLQKCSACEKEYKDVGFAWDCLLEPTTDCEVGRFSYCSGSGSFSFSGVLVLFGACALMLL